MEATLGCLYRILASGAGLILDKSRSASVGRVGFVIPANQFPGNGMRERQLDPKDRRAMQRHHGRMYGLQVVNDQDVAHPWHRMPQLLWACNLDDGLLLLDTSHWQLIWPTRELNYIRQREQEEHDPTCLSVLQAARSLPPSPAAWREAWRCQWLCRLEPWARDEGMSYCVFSCFKTDICK